MRQFASDQQLAERYGVSRKTIWRWTARGLLPPPVQLSPGCTRWALDEIDRRDAERKAQSTQ
jgi:prophage regulatory protein